MGVLHAAGVVFFRTLTRTICRVDDSQLAKVPDRGPLILIVNHVHIMELPLIYTHLLPRPLTALVAAKRWEQPWTRILVQQAGAIALHRGTADLSALREALKALDEGMILVMSPEGTRSGSGHLQKGHPGVALLALHSGAPILPMVHFGSEEYKRNVARLRRSDFHIAVGRPFRLSAGNRKITRQVRREMTDEIMYRLAALLPPENRGVYANPDLATSRYIVPT